MSKPDMQPAVIVLAAGQGLRFRASGKNEDKLQAKLFGKSVLEHVMSAVAASGLPSYVVERVHTAHLTNPGMGDSIACGVAATPDANGWLVLPADLPLIQTQTLLSVAAALTDHAVVVPRYKNQQGHPVGFSALCRQALLEIRGDKGARSVVAQHEAYRLEVVDEGCVLDVDTMDMLALAEKCMHERNVS